MTRIIIALLAFALAPGAMSAAPARISKNATILDSDDTVLREGSNKWTCMPGGPPGSRKYPMCNDPVFMKWSNTVWKGKPFSTDTVGYSYMLIMPSHDLLADQSGDPGDDDIFVLFKNTDYEIVIIPLGDVITE